jgi:hypothetical protein
MKILEALKKKEFKDEDYATADESQNIGDDY